MQFSKDQIKRAKELAGILFPEYDEREWRFVTSWGVKTNTGIINLILEVMYDKA